jgi:DNA polymerase
MKRLDYLKAMGIEAWQARRRVCQVEEDLRLRGDDILGGNADDARTVDTWQSLQAQAEACQACVLAQTRTRVVFGMGSQHAKLLIIGEAPGANEDKQGEPFVGRAGQLLTNMLQSIGLQREQVYIANILKCRPPENRDPKVAEVQACTPFLERQINLLQPTVILALGRIAAHFLLATNDALTTMRGKEYRYQNTPLLVSYHPAYLLRSPQEKRKSQQDLLALKKYL